MAQKSNGKLKVMIGIPGYEGVVPEAQEQLLSLAFRIGRETDFDIGCKIITKKEQFRARNTLVNLAIGGGFDYLLMLDDDMVIPHDLLRKLLSHEKDVVGALYYQRGGLFRPVVMDMGEENKYGEVHHRFWNHNDPRIIDKPGLYEVDVIGGGCMLIKVACFEKLVPPYFYWEKELGTDISICMRLKQAGYQIYCDTSIELGHVGERQVITGKTIPIGRRLINEVIERLGEDLEAYYHQPAEWVRQQMELSLGKEQRKQYWGDTDANDWESVKRYYQDHDNWHIFNLAAFNAWFPNEIRNWCITEGKRLLAPGDTVLDYGPGIGFVSVPLAEQNTVYAVDIKDAGTLDFLSFRSRRTLENPNHLQIVETETPWPSEPLPKKVQLAVIISVLNHLTHPYDVITWIRDQMVPGGYLVCDWHLPSDHDDGNEPQHIDQYDSSTFRSFLYSLGFVQRPEHPWLFQLPI